MFAGCESGHSPPLWWLFPASSGQAPSDAKPHGVQSRETRELQIPAEGLSEAKLGCKNGPRFFKNSCTWDRDDHRIHEIADEQHFVHQIVGFCWDAPKIHGRY